MKFLVQDGGDSGGEEIVDVEGGEGGGPPPPPSVGGGPHHPIHQGGHPQIAPLHYHAEDDTARSVDAFLFSTKTLF